MTGKHQHEGGACCRLEAILPVDERGQMVLPRAVRDRFGIQAGARLALTVCEDAEGNLCCLTLVRTEDLDGMVTEFLRPALSEILR